MSSKFINRGAYGDVWSYPQDKRAVKLLEIKESDISTLQSAAREIYVLIRGGTRLVPFLKAEFKYGSVELHMQLMDTDLSREMKSRALTLEESRTFTADIANGLHWMHAHGISHRDLKPSNVLIHNKRATLCDFGLSRPFCDSTRANNLTDYMVTRWYRAPEILNAKSNGYTEKIDMWAFGCIVYEMIVRRPMFPVSDAKDLPKELKRLDEKINRIRDTTMKNIARGLLHIKPEERWDPCKCLDELKEPVPTVTKAYYTGSRITDLYVKGWVTALLSRYPGREHSIMHGLMLFEVSGRTMMSDFHCAMAIAYLIFEKMPCRCGMFKELTQKVSIKKIAEWMCTYYCGTHMLHEYEKTKDVDAIMSNICAHLAIEEEHLRSKKKRRID